MIHQSLHPSSAATRALVVPPTAKLHELRALTGWSRGPHIRAGFAHHLGVKISIVRNGMADSVRRLRHVAERLHLTGGDLLLIRAPAEGHGLISFSAVTDREIAEADAELRLTLLLGVEHPSALSSPPTCSKCSAMRRQRY